jgi:UDP-N-acetyl-D-galactosamine dehydrogenase
MMERIAVVGLGYVGLPVALAFARKFPGTVGFDIDERRVAALREGVDVTGEVASDVLRSSGLNVTSDPAALVGATFFVVTVPTPIDGANRPDLTAVKAASASVGRALQAGGVVVYESTVYPGVTEDVCAPILERVSGLPRSSFAVGYSPERINPGDQEHRLERITKVVAGEDGPTRARVAAAYGAIIDAGVHLAGSIKVAEMAKVIENTQRDLNIALMNEVALICERLGIETRDVVAAARTKWNFLPFTPGLVGGHCIGVDPYYLTSKAEELGYHPEVILAGRRINDSMGALVARRLVKAMAAAGRSVVGARVGVLGVTFKEDVPDIRNSRVPDIVAELAEFGAAPIIHDPMADPDETLHHLGLRLSARDALQDLDALVVAVGHAPFRALGTAALAAMVRPGGAVFDVKWLIDRSAFPADRVLLSL